MTEWYRDSRLHPEVSVDEEEVWICIPRDNEPLVDFSKRLQEVTGYSYISLETMIRFLEYEGFISEGQEKHLINFSKRLNESCCCT